MKKLPVDFDDIQKAMEDTVRDAFEYFLDVETGDVIILSQDIINRAHHILDRSFDEDMAEYEEVEWDEECAIPEWVEDEVELAIDIFIDGEDRYKVIPGRNPSFVFNAMKEFAEGIDNAELKESLQSVLDGKGSFRRFKDMLEPYPKERKMWYGYNAKASKQEILDWLSSVGIEPAMDS